MKNYTVSLWPGMGYSLQSFSIIANNEEDAIDRVTVEVITNNLKAFYLDCSEYEQYLHDCGINEETDEYYTYIDATMDGAPFPVYLLTMNAAISEN